MGRRRNQRTRRTERFRAAYPPEPLPMPAAYYAGDEYPETVRISFTNGRTITYHMNGGRVPCRFRQEGNIIIGYQYRGGDRHG